MPLELKHFLGVMIAREQPLERSRFDTTPPTRYARETDMTYRNSSIALAAFHRLADRWHRTDRDRATLLGLDIDEPVIRSLTDDKERRISYLLGIFTRLHDILGPTDLADAWVLRPNSDFGGGTPLDRMLAGGLDGLAYVRSYVDRWAT